MHSAANEESMNLSLVQDPPIAADLIITSAVMRELFRRVRIIAQTDVAVMVRGETGTGKESVLRALHGFSGRRGRCVVVNCAAIAPTLLESTLFGHERGAFTGASNQRVGIFEHANRGTVCLDEIGELAPDAQAALLRVVETKRLCRVGGTREIDIDVRVVAATHRDLRAMVEEGRFRADLYYRLCGDTLLVPPLRERAEEILLLAKAFLDNACKRWDRRPTEFTPEVQRFFASYSWPGNVRELRNVVEAAAVMCAGERIDLVDLPSSLASSYASQTLDSTKRWMAPELAAVEQGLGFRWLMQHFEAKVIERALEESAGCRAKAADLLKLPHRTFARKLQRSLYPVAASDDEAGRVDE
jgi:transcriptional regulator with GAF, ATPase, and Fis domain